LATASGVIGLLQQLNKEQMQMLKYEGIYHSGIVVPKNQPKEEKNYCHSPIEPKIRKSQC
jgi:hypothetical protein